MNRLSAWQPQLLSVLRIVAGLLFIEHGLQKIFDFPPAAMPHPYVLMTLAPGLAGLIEVIGGGLLILGLFTRYAALICSGEMAAAYFMAHLPRSIYPINNGGDAAVLYCFIFLYIAAAGAGPFSLDAMRRRR
jgi:putative oxidoreductase